MATVIINDKIKAAKLFLEFLKTQPWAKVVENEKIPNARTRKAIEDIEKGRVERFKNAKDIMKLIED